MEDHGPLLPMESAEGVMKILVSTHLYSVAEHAPSTSVVRQEQV